MTSTPYDELPYESRPIEWTAPEHLAQVSAQHGGPVPRPHGYRVLELGCGDGTNLLTLARSRPHAQFVGVDYAASRIAAAEAARAAERLTNVQLVRSDFVGATERISGECDFIIAHGVFSWVADEQRDALLALAQRVLRADGLFYVNYNCLPGWSVRGLVRTFLLQQTSSITGLAHKAEHARTMAARMAEALSGGEHPYTTLLSNEFRFVCENPVSHTAHEYLAAHNRAFSRADFLHIVARAGFRHVADADADFPPGRLPKELPEWLDQLGVLEVTWDDTADLVCYRQLHSPILTLSEPARASCESQPSTESAV